MGAAELKYANGFVDRLFGEGLHAKRVQSLTNATVGVMTSASLAVSTIGHGLALAQGGISKHAIKQVDRLLSNPGIDVKELFMLWVPPIVGSRKSIEIAMDWTDFDADNQTTIMLSLLTSHGRATPLIWLTVDKDTLKDNRNRYEYQVLVWLSEALPADIEDLAITSCTRSSRTILNSTISFVSVGISRSRPPMAKPARLSTGLVRAGACGSCAAPP